MFFRLFGNFSNQNTKIQNETVLERGIRLKREGKYNEAIQCYVNYISKNLKTEKDLNDYLYSLAKVYFLNKDFEASIASYTACALYLAYSKRPEMLRDLANVAVDKEDSPYLMWAADFGRHVGYALIGIELQTNKNTKMTAEDKYCFSLYMDSLAGKDIDYKYLLNSTVEVIATRSGIDFVTQTITSNYQDKQKRQNYFTETLKIALKL